MDLLVENKKLSGTINSVSSKSYGQRAIFLALMAGGESRICIDDLSDDLRAALGIAQTLGELKRDGNTYIIRPKSKKKCSIDVKESGTSLRLIIPILASQGIEGKILRRGTLIKRTLGVYKEILPEKGVLLREDGPYVYLKGQLKPGHYTLPGNVSSQFISGLLLGLGALEEKSKISLSDELESKPYVDMTVQTMEAFGADIEEKDGAYLVGGGYRPASYKVEGDYSSALFFLGLGVGVRNLNPNSLQADRLALDFLKSLGYADRSTPGICKFTAENKADRLRILDAKNMPDSVPALAVFSAARPGLTKVINIERLRLKESDRVESTLAMLRSLGLRPRLDGNSFSFEGVQSFKSCQIDSFADHRIAMAGAASSNFASGPILIKNAGVFKKSYPKFLEDFKSLGGSFYVQ